MAALPYIRLYVADYLADTMHLTTEEHGVYLLLIMNYWQTGKPIPAKRLASVARMSNDRWISVEDTLSEFFTETKNGDWYHGRIEAELEKVMSKSKQASIAGKASAKKRASAKLTQASDSNGRSKPVERESNHTDTDTDTEADKTEKELVPPGKDPVKPSRQIPYKKIIETLNEKTGKSFLHTTKSTQHMIRARFSEKFIFDDFVAVIEHMAFQWSGDDKMNQYLRPQTLFGTKFEGYLQDSRAGKIERKKSEWIKN